VHQRIGSDERAISVSFTLKAFPGTQIAVNK